MQDLENFYTSVDSCANDIIGRLGGNAALVKRFLAKFPSDGSYNELQSALASDDTATAFRAAHTLKGLCANLGINSLYKRSSEITEMLRAGDIISAKDALPSLDSEYKRVLSELSKLEG